ncbi:hypothetical protein EA472_03735 [Natrarchaeobius oligotrophus]|uniref:Uncharacterized protein n=1 Tax=Natrarchaeobius chitinivorans TaxID=1679083 RepID=A0A3N6PSD6_NATCH|nr:hypothetical protein EA472_03735 [Natrarchaeobius chitinivorans]
MFGVRREAVPTTGTPLPSRSRATRLGYTAAPNPALGSKSPAEDVRDGVAYTGRESAATQLSVVTFATPVFSP